MEVTEDSCGRSLVMKDRGYRVNSLKDRL